MAGVSIFVLGVPAQVVFNQYYYSPAWQQVFALDNSFVLWGVGLALALWARNSVFAVFAASGLLHIAFDFPLHNEDARPHFWPLSDWVFVSPVSYWDPAHYGEVVGWIEWAACALCLVILWRRFTDWMSRACILVGALVQVAPMIAWRILF